MNEKDKIDLMVKRAELIYKKLFIFLAIAGGSWIYGLKDTENTLLRILVFMVFFLTAFAIILNLLKFGEIQKELKEFNDD
jgi:preprotein translocase subunit SecG